MTEFCPKCGAPLDTSGDESRLCEYCGWFGDSGESVRRPPDADEFNPVLAVIQALTMFRDVCRDELVAEQVYDAGDATETELRKVKVAARESLQALVQLFTATRRPHSEPPTILRHDNGRVAWPAAWTDYHYNNCDEPCDVLAGACACGTWHTPTEDWVQEILARHHTVIE